MKIASSFALLALLQRLPRRPLRRVPRRALPSGAGRARRGMFHARRVEGRPPPSLIVPCRAAPS